MWHVLCTPLRGSAAAVGHARFSRIAGAAEHYINALQRGSGVLDSEAQRVLSAIVDPLRVGVDARQAEPEGRAGGSVAAGDRGTA